MAPGFDARAVEVWTPSDDFPAVERERLVWQPPGAVEPFELSLTHLYRPIKSRNAGAGPARHDVPDPAPMPDVRWDIRRSGRAWTPDEAMGRYQLTPEKFEMVHGKLFWSEAERLTLLALLLENVGMDQAVRLGDPAVWRAAVRT